MMQEGDWIYTLEVELHGRLRNEILATLSDRDLARILTALSLSRIALTLEALMLHVEDEHLLVRVEGEVKTV